MAARTILAQLAPLSPSKLITRANSRQKEGKSNYNEEQVMIRNESSFHQEVLS
jgi:hypothetical protein